MNRTNTNKTEWAIKSGQSSDTGDIMNMTNTNKRKKHNTTQHRKLKWRVKLTPHKKLGVNSGAREREAVPASLKTPVVLLI
jgi:hypothetical protein